MSLLAVACQDEDRVAGNSTDIGSGIVAGRIVQPGGTPAANAWVECVPLGTTPWDEHRPGWSVSSDSEGRFTCRDLPEGPVGVSSLDPGSGLTRWRLDTARSKAIALHLDTLALPGALRIALPPSTSGILYMSGLGWRRSIHGEGEVEIPVIPAGWCGTLFLARSTTESVTLDSGLHVAPGSLDSIGFTAGSSVLRIPLAGPRSSPIGDIPVLVRLDSSWRGFAGTLADGSDLRARSTDGTSLPLTVSRWDKEGRTGAFWILLDSLSPAADSLDLVLDHGLPVKASSPRGAFVASEGWTAVWPLGDTGGVVLDRLGRFPGIPSSVSSTTGPTGPASRFDGSVSKVVFPGTAQGSVVLPNGGPYTMSCWARLRTFTFSRHLMGYGELSSALKYQGASSSSFKNSWFVQDFRDAPLGKYFTGSPADTAVWTHVATTIDKDSVKIYVDGVCKAAATSFDRSDLPRSLVDFALGVSLDSIGVGSYYFPGDLAEAWVHSVARSPDWIRFAYENQKPTAPPARTLR